MDPIQGASSLEEPTPFSGDTLSASRPLFAFDSLAAVRKKLLDLSGRNPLLNYRHPKGGCVRVIDELPDHLYQRLLEGRALSFAPVPDPTEKELIAEGYIAKDKKLGLQTLKPHPNAETWAARLGLATDFELPLLEQAGKHQDLDIQTLLYPRELETRLRTLRGKSQTAIEESGSQVLYLVMGFLEWSENAGDEQARLAPLFTLPVRLERTRLDQKQGVYRYAVSLKDEGLLTNITLREKLAASFNLALPEVPEDTTPEAYFALVEQAVLSHRPHWKVRRMVSLAVLNFSKQVMYEDLDPERWPSERRIDQHAVIGRFFGAGDTRPRVETSYRDEHPLDGIEDIHERYPIVFDADSSQHSALIDAVNGENLVIEGPPGSGKSQTITNLIAACIANGKKVLFVAEKLAALEVVKSRLERAGLGDFCLELHSHRTSRQQLLEDLKNRLDRQGDYEDPQSIDADIARLEELKRKLKDYVELINSKWKYTGMSLHAILNRAARYRELLKIDPESLAVEGVNGEELTIIRQKELNDHAQMLTGVFAEVQSQAAGALERHHWYGVNNPELLGYEIEDLLRHLSSWNGDLLSLATGLGETCDREHLPFQINQPLPIVAALVEQLQTLPPLLGYEPMVALPMVIADQTSYEEFLNGYIQLHERLDALARVFKAELLDNPLTATAPEEQIVALKALGLKETDTLEQAHKDLQQLKEAEKLVGPVAEHLAEIAPHLPAGLRIACRVSETGLAELTALLRLVDQLPPELWPLRADVFDRPELDALLPAMRDKLQELAPLAEELKPHFALAQLPDLHKLERWRDVIGSAGVFSFLSPRWRSANKGVMTLATSFNPDKKRLMALLPKLVEYARGREELEALSGRKLLGDRFRGVDTPVEQLLVLRAWYRAVREEYGLGFEPRAALGHQLLGLDSDLAKRLAATSQSPFGAQARQLHTTVVHLRQRYLRIQPLQNRFADLTVTDSPLKHLLFALYAPVVSLLQRVSTPAHSLAEISRAAVEVAEVHRDIAKWKQLEVTRKLVPEYLNLQLQPGQRDKVLLDSAQNLLEIARRLEACAPIRTALEHLPTDERYQALREAGEVLQERLDWANASFALFVGLGEVEPEQWFASSGGALLSLIERNDRALANPDWLNSWLDYIRLRRRLAKEGLGSIVKKLEADELKLDQLADAVQLALSHQLAQEVLREHPSLAQFNGLEQTEIRSRFRDYDKAILTLQRQKIAARASRNSPPEGIASGKVSDYSEAALIRHEAGKKARHIAVRSLLGRAGGAVAALKPCFMMSPMSVAQYLAPGQFEFDIVIMDEASQIRPEDALGAIARGRSFVVVGDPKQLPPTDFFQNLLQADESDEVVALEETESILDAVTPMFKTRRLRWHYRSRHESLIAFSNLHFYGSDLVLFPSPFQRSEEFGIRYQRVERGRFARGKNAEEARALARAAAQHLLEHPDESLGLVAMNAEQREEIERHVEELVKADPALLEAYERNQAGAEPLFIKNLENVQGDERDVVMISMTYGPDEMGGKVHQRFGPINQAVGWRRLNVLFTRSRKRMHIFSSMASSDIALGEGHRRGVAALRAFLEYCETGYLSASRGTSGVPSSDFQFALMRALAERGYPSEPHFGITGYFLDLAVKDPARPGRFLMGIESDGPSYLAAKSTRDRERLRQEVLEGLGWRVRRIWSPDWFRNPEAQLQPILQELAVLKSSGGPAAAAQPPEPEASAAALPAFADPGAQLSLQERLLELDASVIRKQFKRTPAQRRLLRPAMLDALLQQLPTSREEFAERIPHYLRVGTEPKEEQAYLEQVLALVADYG